MNTKELSKILRHNGELGRDSFDVNDKVKGNDILNIQNALQIFVNTGPSCMTHDEFNTI